MTLWLYGCCVVEANGGFHDGAGHARSGGVVQQLVMQIDVVIR